MHGVTPQHTGFHSVAKPPSPRRLNGAGTLEERPFANAPYDGPDGAEDVLHDAPERLAAKAPLVRVGDLLGQPMQPRDWLVPDVIPCGQVTELRGAGGTGKSTAAMQLAACAASGRAWFDLPVKKGAALVLAAEDDLPEQHRRCHAIATHLRLPDELLNDFYLWPLATEDPALMVPGRDGLVTTPRWDELEAHVRAIRPVVVVLDSRADVFAGNEIDRLQTRTFVGRLRKLAIESGAAVVVLAHPSQSGLADGTGNSGSTHWNNAARNVLNLTRPKAEAGDPGDPDMRTLEMPKANYGPPMQPIALRWSAGAFVVDGEDVCRAPVSRMQAEAEAEKLFLRLLDQWSAAGRTVSDRPSGAYAPAMFAASPEAKAAGVKAPGLKAAMERLFARGDLEMVEGGRPSKRWRTMARKAGP